MTGRPAVTGAACRVPAGSPVPDPGPLGVHHLYSCPRWLHVLALGGRPPGGWVTAGGRGLLPVHRGLPTRNRRYATATLFRDLPGGIPSGEFCYAGALSAYQAEVPTRPGGGGDEVAALLDEAGAWSGGADRLVVPYLTHRVASALPARLAARLVPEDVEAWSPPGVSTVAELLTVLPRKQRQNAQRNQRHFDRSGLTAAAEPLGACLDEFAVLAEAASRKHGQHDDSSALRRHLAAIADTFGADAVVFAARDRAGLLAGAVLGVRHDGDLFMRMSGFDEERTRGSAAYFTLMFYLPLDGAPAGPPPAVHYGAGSLAPKLHHGARLDPLWTLLPTVVGPAERAAVLHRRLAGLPAEVPEGVRRRFIDLLGAGRARSGEG
ncbi:GNAT family N-acetyltransferase [Micromonospora mirobrigensis]|uniref:Acetyltransferase (GNAT) domain-containing protein n=1 Tax=Micromonospora mirobrigensis TaxID=262898 RepID=A0A1C4WW14_9ACTN|nr:GNAT family N-acetyltransferase [Micromonospora mirobrigensis]SCF00324.1 Acetyltransferase (GNAT) domain-containing protein [Micromonospora mirobrigensis]